ncbi:MAG: O-methyltransferase [Bacilli bacterium]|nr:O-methyltransferase [Bacilli bacterium]MDD4547205.1 O-methyltransferase [Bacilli bacterium]
MDKIEAYAKANNIPIMEEFGIKFLTDFIKENKIKRILEIGSAIGYSAIKMALVDKDIFITTIERDEQRYQEAVKNIREFNLEDRINIMNVDAFDAIVDDKYDLIFIDAAKGQYIKFFEKFKENLNYNGFIISDNINFHGLTKNPDKITSHNLKALVRKINNYIDFLKNNEEFTTNFIEIGDGISISKRSK